MSSQQSGSLFNCFEYFRHLFAYDQVIKDVLEGRILEVGCGEGYGASYLKSHLPKTYYVASDYYKHTLNYVKQNYPEIKLCQTLASSLSFTDNSFDAVLSFQVIEHIKEAQTFIAEIFRVLKPSGKAFISTPNSRLRLLFFQKPWNPYHVHEYNDDQLKKVLGVSFNKVSLYGIAARDDLQEMEMRRVKQNPLKVILRPGYRCFKNIMSRITTNSAQGVLKINDSEKEVGADIAVGLNDFSLSVNIHGCLDLFAIAAKV